MDKLPCSQVNRSESCLTAGIHVSGGDYLAPPPFHVIDTLLHQDEQVMKMVLLFIRFFKETFTETEDKQFFQLLPL